MKGRRLVQMIERICDASGIDDLVGGALAEAGTFYALLRECSRGDAGQCFDAICRVAARRRVTPGYVVDRAHVLIASAEVRRAGDLYRILGVPSLAPAETIRARWREVVKECHPDVAGAGSSERFREIQAAHEVLGDAERRAAYERMWRRTIAHIERAIVAAETVELDIPPAGGGRAGQALRALAGRVGGALGVGVSGPVSATGLRLAGQGGGMNGPLREGEGMKADLGSDRRMEPEEDRSGVVAGTESMERGRAPEAPAVDGQSPARESKQFEEGTMQDVLRRTDAMFQAVRGIDQRLSGAGFEGVGAVARLFEQLHTALESVSVEEIDSTMADVDRARQALETIGRDLGRLRRLKLSLGDGGPSSH